LTDFSGSQSLGEWADLAGRATNKRGAIGSKGNQIFKSDNFAVHDVVFSPRTGNIEFRFSFSEPIVYLEKTEFLLKILQSQAFKNGSGCWFFGEKLSRYQVYLKDYLERARRLGLVRKYKISNRKNWLQVAADNPKTERTLHLIEPVSQLLSHTQTAFQVPSKNPHDWLKVTQMANVKPQKKSHKVYGELWISFNS